MPKKLIKKTLSKTDIYYRMAIPMDSLRAFQIQEGEYSKEFKVIDINGRVWTFTCSTRRTDPYPKPVLSSGWRKYVKHRGLKEGDEVTLYQMEKDGADVSASGLVPSSLGGNGSGRERKDTHGASHPEMLKNASRYGPTKLRHTFELQGFRQLSSGKTILLKEQRNTQQISACSIIIPLPPYKIYKRDNHGTSHLERLKNGVDLALPN
ncbi:unnamed protein product [Dovyalis caffra]|uniref:TF-B3 domain-containing protein n=1 Tax=Dovyalis caffra TaxID=77055 RepID=A0AAV1SSR3_9ROSI|nr:unnamed protein product [Dovyalis caffra]